MIVVDTSALLAIALNEPQADACARVLESEEEVLVSAGTLAELLIVAGQRNLGAAASRLIARFGLTVVPVTATSATHIGNAYTAWGKGNHPAALNLGDCFAYVVAREYGCPLLYVGNDFAKTDVTSAL